MPATLQSKEMQNLELITEGTNKFAINFYLELPREPAKNIICSPISAQIPLTLAYYGAGGSTAEEMKTALHVPDNKDQSLEGMKALLQGLENPTLKMVTKMFIDKNFEIKPEYKCIADTYFLSGLEVKDFKNHSNEVRVHINSWVEEQTNNKIKDLLPQDAVTPATRMILVNAIHFKGKWKYPFDPNETKKASFYVTPNETVEVDMMKLEDKRLKYYESEILKAQIVEIPYSDGELSMVIILPNEIDGLTQVEEKLRDHLPDELANTRETSVNVQMPKFKIEAEMQLKDVLSKMGIKSAFGDRANFSHIAQEPLYIDNIIQKAFIEVNEEGTEAAAATAATLRTRRAIISREEVVCDHPYGFMIIHTPTGSVMFASRVTDIHEKTAHSPSHEEL